MHRKEFKTGHKVLLIFVIIIIIIVIFSRSLNNQRELNKFESLIKDSVTSVEKIVLYPVNLLVKKIDDFNELKDIRKKYQELLVDVKRIEEINTENIELRKQLKTMKEELDIDYTLNEYEYLNATVISRNVSHWYNTITIDKGTYNGVENSMIVVNSEGLIGRVVSTTAFTSDVRLLTTSDTSNKISVTISDGNNYVNGLIKNYNYQNNVLEVEGVSNTESINEGDYVYTSGLGGIFPSGILVGIVEKITTDEYDLAKIIDVSPVVNFNDINYVAILKRKEIKRDDLE